MADRAGHLAAVPSDPDVLRAWLAERDQARATTSPHPRRQRTPRRREPRATVDVGGLFERLRAGPRDVVSQLSPSRAEQVGIWLDYASQQRLTADDLDELTEPYRLLLSIVGSGVQLTRAGYLPPTLARRLAEDLRMHPARIGSGQRESSIWHLGLFRRTVQSTGLLRIRNGRLEPTTAGIRVDDPAALWRHVAARLPTGRTKLEKGVGWLALLATAGGVQVRDIHPLVRDLAADVGWQARTVGRGYTDVDKAIWPVTAALRTGQQTWIHTRPSWLPAAGASVVFADPPG